MKLFQLIRKNFMALGIDSKQAFDSTKPYNKKILGCFFMIGLNNIFFLVYMFHIAESFLEYTESMYMASAAIVIGVIFICLVLKMKKLFELIDGIEKHINGEEK